ncbi:hypothetical protein HDIA_0366 [Hartmannibacter diazotrophicus]|uniref:Integral membrane protein n=1 Tax=Hartmannibacter diazotrophicus TaxID=1482074 RepID=A0A2C9D0K0_9HYPH|nr:hypothetical protein [Hartmannibacter diazotrophicus]SON53907.1 hypothetical protein HDIA_0366 [Hartmannibacter diazotrophicus]
MSVCRVLTGLYLLLCLVSLVLVPLNAAGAFGMEPDPLSGVFAYFLSLPWCLIAFHFVGDPSLASALLVAAISMGLNAFLLHAHCRKFARISAAEK